MPDPHRIVISNTTPIIALSLVQQLNLFRAYIRTVALDDPRRADLLSDLDPGEAEVIALAQEHDADLVIIDERLGRRHARRLGLPLTGVLGVLIKAKQRGYLDVIRPHVEQMQRGGIRLGDALVARALEMVGE